MCKALGAEREVFVLNGVSEDEIRQRAEYIKYIYNNMEKYPSSFDSFPQPVAAYDREGRVVGATMAFRELAGIPDDDAGLGSVNISGCFIGQNAEWVGAAHGVFNGAERILRGPRPPGIRPDAQGAQPEPEAYADAAFFPITYGQEGVTYGAVMLMRKEETESGPVTKNIPSPQGK